jgi:hypothetical protein
LRGCRARELHDGESTLLGSRRKDGSTVLCGLEGTVEDHQVAVCAQIVLPRSVGAGGRIDSKASLNEASAGGAGGATLHQGGFEHPWKFSGYEEGGLHGFDLRKQLTGGIGGLWASVLSSWLLEGRLGLLGLGRLPGSALLGRGPGMSGPGLSPGLTLLEFAVHLNALSL